VNGRRALSASLVAQAKIWSVIKSRVAIEGSREALLPCEWLKLKVFTR
jgi:hypothetical protein